MLRIHRTLLMLEVMCAHKRGLQKQEVIAKSGESVYAYTFRVVSPVASVVYAPFESSAQLPVS